MVIQRYLAMGFGPRQMSNDLAILVRPGQPRSLGCAFWFWVFVFFPIAIVMALSGGKQTQDQSVTIRLEQSTTSLLAGPEPFAPELPRQLQMSDDREWWWDGRTWVDASESTPPMATKSPDERLWWDGEEWRAVR